MNCKICTHPNRGEIELSILNLSDTITVETISQEFEVSEEDVRMHALMHSPLNTDSDEADTLAKQIKLREAEMLSRTAHDYLITMTSIGRRIRYYSENQDALIGKLMSKSVVDLYLGCGAEIRQTVNALSDLNSKINGDPSAKTGLQALADALAKSAQP